MPVTHWLGSGKDMVAVPVEVGTLSGSRQGIGRPMSASEPEVHFWRCSRSPFLRLSCKLTEVFVSPWSLSNLARSLSMPSPGGHHPHPVLLLASNCYLRYFSDRHHETFTRPEEGERVGQRGFECRIGEGSRSLEEAGPPTGHFISLTGIYLSPGSPTGILFPKQDPRNPPFSHPWRVGQDRAERSFLLCLYALHYGGAGNTRS